MDRLRALRYFKKLAETLNFSETADHFRVPSSSVSRRIKDLESELGAALFIRTTRSVRLTDLGKLYLSEITSALHSIDMADEMVNAQSGAPSGLVRITAMPNYAELYVLPALNRLRQRYSEIIFDLNITDEVINLSGNDVDIAIRATSDLPDQVVARHLCEHKFVLVASPQYIAENELPRHSAELRNHPVFMYRTPRGRLDWLALNDGAWTALELSPKYITNHGPSLLAYATDGNGLAFLPSWGVEKHLASGRLQIIDLEDGPLSIVNGSNMGMYLLYHPPKFRLHKIKVTVDFLIAALHRTTKTV